MTKLELSQYIDLNRECDDLRKRIDELDKEKECSIVQSSMPEFPYTRTRVQVYGKTEIRRKRIANMRSLLYKRLDDAEAAMERVMEFIETVPDSRTRMILRHKYLDGWTWERIGEVMGYDHTSVEKRVNRYLKKNG